MEDTPTPPGPPPSRQVEFDLLRGWVMVWMTLDHASQALNQGRLVTDGAFLYTPETPLPPAQFLLRWGTHICAPTFVFLAGVALALSVSKRVRRQEPVGRHLAIRGGILILLDLCFVSFFWLPGKFELQVLYALGGGILCLSILRFLPTSALALLALGLSLGQEALVGLWIHAKTAQHPAGILLLHGGGFSRFVVAYPLLAWLSPMLWGWVFGTSLNSVPRQDRPRTLARWSLSLGILSSLIFLGVRAANGYGNMRLYRFGGGLLQWLHVSKYPPSLSFLSLEFALMFFALFALGKTRAARHPDRFRDHPLLVWGQAALFFYLAHIALLEGLAQGFGIRRQFGIPSTLLASGLTCLLLYPLCRRYRSWKAKHPESLLRYF